MNKGAACYVYPGLVCFDDDSGGSWSHTIGYNRVNTDVKISTNGL